MSTQEIPITLTPQQAATGITTTIPLQGGTTATLRIPPARDGDLVRAQIGTTEVLLRVRISSTPAAPQPAKTNPLGCLIALVVVIGVIAGLVILSNDDDSDSTASGSPTPTRSARAWSPAPLPTLNLPDLQTSEPPAPTPYDKGTCLNGTLPDSTTAQRVNDVDEVSCTASNAHYRVIERFSLTSDLHQCDNNPKTEYAFSARYTRGGTVINEYVYCLVGIGSYARP